jgi:hypothetical protein
MSKPRAEGMAKCNLPGTWIAEFNTALLLQPFFSALLQSNSFP